MIEQRMTQQPEHPHQDQPLSYATPKKKNNKPRPLIQYVVLTHYLVSLSLMSVATIMSVPPPHGHAQRTLLAQLAEYVAYAVIFPLGLMLKTSYRFDCCSILFLIFLNSLLWGCIITPMIYFFRRQRASRFNHLRKLKK